MKIIQAAIAMLLIACISAGAQEPERSSDGKSDKNIDRLIAQLGVDDFAQREDAQNALRKIGFSAFKRLRKACDGDDAEISQRARAIIGDYDGITALLDKLPQDWHTTLYYNGPTQTQSALAGHGDAAVPYIAERISTEKDGLFRFNCVTILNSIQTPAALACLRKLAKDENAWCRVESAWALGNAKDSESLPLLANAMSDADETVRKEAMLAVGKIAHIRIFWLGPNSVAEFPSAIRMKPEAVAELERVAKIYLEKKKFPDAEELDGPRAVPPGQAGIIIIGGAPLDPHDEKLKGDWTAKTFSASNGQERWIVVRYDADPPEKKEADE